MYKSISCPIIFKIGEDNINNIDVILQEAHLYFKGKILITQKELFNLYASKLNKNEF